MKIKLFETELQKVGQRIIECKIQIVVILEQWVDLIENFDLKKMEI